MKTSYGFFSEKASKDYGSLIYATPDGREVEITAVYHDAVAESYKWPDKKYVGEVTEWVRDGRTVSEMVRLQRENSRKSGGF